MNTPARRFLILHGVENRRPPEHWQYWLAEQLRRRREVVLYPQLPDPDSPNLESWLELVRAELAQLGDGERVVLCHSLAALAWLQLADRLAAGERVQRVLLVSPPGSDVLWPEIAHFALPPTSRPTRSAPRATRRGSSAATTIPTARQARTAFTPSPCSSRPIGFPREGT